MPIVASANQLSLNSLYYKIRGDVQKTIGSIYAPKFVSGDFDTTSREGVSILEWTNWSNGIGLERFNDPRQNTQSWWSECTTRFPGHLLLPPRTVDMTGESTSQPMGLGIGLAALWKPDSTGSIEKSTDGSAFGAEIADLGINDDGYFSLVTAKYDGTDYFIVGASASGKYHFSSNGTSFTGGGLRGDFLIDWDNRLWGLDISTGQLWFTLKPSATTTDHTIDAQLSTENNTALGIIVADDALGNPILYVLTTTALWAHDAPNARFVKTKFTIPAVRFNTSLDPVNRRIQMAVWRDSLYIPVGLTVFEFSAPRGVIRSIGPGAADQGVPDEQGGNIRTLIPTHAGLVGLIEGTAAATTTAAKSSVIMFSIHGNTAGWEVLFNSSKTNDNNFVATAGVVNALYRLWWGDSADMKFQTLPDDLQNPKNIAGYNYEDGSSKIHQTPIFDVGPDVNGIALRTKVQVKDATVNDTVVVAFDINESGSFTSHGTITTDGTTEYEFPNSTTPSGSAFRTIQYQLTLTTGNTTRSPDVLGLALEYERKLPVRYQYSFVVDARTDYKDRTSKTMLEDLEAAVESSTKVEFNYKGADPDLPEYVDVVNIEAVEKSGFTEEGFWRVTVVDR